MSNKYKKYTGDFENAIAELYKSSNSLSELDSKYGAFKSTPIQVDKNKTIIIANY